MRIRAIKPDFWRSEDIKALPFEVRLLFIGLWSYVDDNGVGIDDPRLIAADLFALEDDPKDIREYVREGLARLSRGLQIVRYEADGRRLLFVTNWDKHQKIDRPGKPRHPRPETIPTSPNDDELGLPETSSRDSRDSFDAGTGEQGNRGTGEKGSPTAVDLVTTDRAGARGVSGSNSANAYRLVDRTLGRGLTSATRTALAIEVAALLPEVDETTLTAGLERWNQRTGIGPRILPGLVDDIRKEARGATTQPARAPVVNQTDANIAAFLGGQPTQLRALPRGNTA